MTQEKSYYNYFSTLNTHNKTPVNSKPKVHKVENPAPALIHNIFCPIRSEPDKFYFSSPFEFQKHWVLIKLQKLSFWFIKSGMFRIFDSSKIKKNAKFQSKNKKNYQTSTVFSTIKPRSILNSLL
jgi:hypothetical protein